MRVHFWRKDVDVNFVKTYDEEGKKMLEVQKNTWKDVRIAIKNAVCK